MRVPLEAYLRGSGNRVYSLVARIPFSPIDIDLGHLARGEWNPLTDRFRVWFLPAQDGEKPAYYTMVRKFDPNDRVVLYAHVVANMGAKQGVGEWIFTVGIMCNDEVRARSMLNSMLDIPPSFHRRSEVKLVERRWRTDSEAVMRFMINVHSALARVAPDPGGKVYSLRFEPPAGMMGEFRRNLDVWW